MAPKPHAPRPHSKKFSESSFPRAPGSLWKAAKGGRVARGMAGGGTRRPHEVVGSQLGQDMGHRLTPGKAGASWGASAGG